MEELKCPRWRRLALIVGCVFVELPNHKRAETQKCFIGIRSLFHDQIALSG